MFRLFQMFFEFPRSMSGDGAESESCASWTHHGRVLFHWRKPVGVEPTSDTKYRSPGLKPGPSTGRNWLPLAIVAGGIEAYVSSLAIWTGVAQSWPESAMLKAAFDRSASLGHEFAPTRIASPSNQKGTS